MEEIQYAVQLQNSRTIIVRGDWIQNKNPKKWTKIFRSKVKNKTPNFSLPTKFFLTDDDACYNGLCLRQITGKYLPEKNFF